MKLSELKTGEKGVIVKVQGHGGFRKRIIEMGFIKGTEVEVLLNAPLQDPVKYKLMGYEVSLRHQEADNIEVVSADTPLEETTFEGASYYQRRISWQPQLRQDLSLQFCLWCSRTCGQLLWRDSRCHRGARLHVRL